MDQKNRFVTRIGFVRLIVFFVLLSVVYAGGHVAVHEILLHAPARMTGTVAVIGAALISVLAISVYGLLVGLFEHRAPLELAPRRGAPLLLGGMGIGFAIFIAVYAILWGTGHAVWGGFVHSTMIARFAAAAVVAAICEELIIRGGVYRILEDMFGSAAALIVSGALFGVMHLGNPHATAFSAVAIALEAGVLLAAAYAASRNLWLPIGLHIGWNFTEGGIFGAAVSGGGGGHGIVSMPLHGPALLTGGRFGPEASVVAVALCLAVGVLFLIQTVRRGRWVRASFHMMLD